MQDEWLEGGDVWTRSKGFLDLVRFEVLDLVHRLWPGGAWKADMPDLVQGVKVDLVHCPAISEPRFAQIALLCAIDGNAAGFSGKMVVFRATFR